MTKKQLFKIFNDFHLKLKFKPNHVLKYYIFKTKKQFFYKFSFKFMIIFEQYFNNIYKIHLVIF